MGGKAGKGGGGGLPLQQSPGPKGGGKAGGGKAGGGGKGPSGPCWHCGEPGHRRPECPKFLRAKGNPGPGALNQMTADGEGGLGGIVEEDESANEWAFGSLEDPGFPPALNGTLNSLAAEVPVSN